MQRWFTFLDRRGALVAGVAAVLKSTGLKTRHNVEFYAARWGPSLLCIAAEPVDC
jgi:hypothetical protein